MATGHKLQLFLNWKWKTWKANQSTLLLPFQRAPSPAMASSEDNFSLLPGIPPPFTQKTSVQLENMN